MEREKEYGKSGQEKRDIRSIEGCEGIRLVLEAKGVNGFVASVSGNEPPKRRKIMVKTIPRGARKEIDQGAAWARLRRRLEPGAGA
jgi:hypothetical protein